MWLVTGSILRWVCMLTGGGDFTRSLLSMEKRRPSLSSQGVEFGSERCWVKGLAFAFVGLGLAFAAPRPDHLACARGGFPLDGEVVIEDATFGFAGESQDFRFETVWL
jgi:hypothetical protein